MSSALGNLADEIRVCVGKAENYYATVGVKLRAAQLACRPTTLGGLLLQAQFSYYWTMLRHTAVQ